MTPRQMAKLTVALAVLAAALACGAAFIKYKATGKIDWLAIAGGVLVVLSALTAADRIGKSGG